MELELGGGDAIPVERDSVAEIGRRLGLGFQPYASDRTVSCRHLSLHFLDDDQCRLCFRVIGRNPIWICPSIEREKSLFRHSEKGELKAGDRFSLSLKNPVFISVRVREGGVKEEEEEQKGVLDAVERRERRTRERKERDRAEATSAFDGLELELGSLDVSGIDPVKDFGFLVKGHEFDSYPARKIRAVKYWNFYLEEPREGCDDDVGVRKGRKGGRRTKRKSRGNVVDDDEWTGESEDEKKMQVKVGARKWPRYSTRSKDGNRSRGDELGDKRRHPKVDVTVEDEDDETLGGFIVDDEEEEAGAEEEEEDEEGDDYDDDED